MSKSVPKQSTKRVELIHFPTIPVKQQQGSKYASTRQDWEQAQYEPSNQSQSTVKKQLSKDSDQQHQNSSQVKCQICKQTPVTVVCLNCQWQLCVNCALQHSKLYVSHELMDTREAYKKIRENAKAMEVKIRSIAQELKVSQNEQINKNVKIKIDGKLFEEQLQKLRYIREQVEGLMARYFDGITMAFASLWDAFIETYGSGAMLYDRVGQLQNKLQSFILENQTDISSSLNKFFSQYVFDEYKRVLNSFDKRSNTNPSSEEGVLPPRLTFDFSKISSIQTHLCELVSASDCQVVEAITNEDKHPLLQITLNTFSQSEGQNTLQLPILPINCPFLYLYNPLTREYQVGEFEDLDNKSIPHFIKSVFIENGDVLLVGGGDINGMPVKTNIRFSVKNGDLTLMEQLPRAKNPANGLIYFEGNVYVIGGMRIEDEKYQWTRSCEMYSLKTNKWTILEEMKFKKPHQSVFKFNKFIFALGISITDQSNIERYDIEANSWKLIELALTSQNPLSYSAGFQAIQINSKSVLLFGGKNFYQDQDNLTITDADINRNLYLFDGDTMFFTCQGQKHPGTGVSYGEYPPIVLNEKVIYFESPISKLHKLHRWYQIVQCLEIKNTKNGLEVEMIQVMSSE